MTATTRFTVALDLAKHTHVATIFDSHSGQADETTTIAITKQGFADFEKLLTSYSGDPHDFLIGCEATGHYGETLLWRLQKDGYPIVRLEASLTVKALAMALQQRQPAADALLHSDRGSQYTAAEYRQVLEQHDLQQSMSRKGNVWDNAAMEAFFSTLEFECLRGRHFATRAQAKTEVFSYIEAFYNRKRLHSTLGYVSPAEFEALKQPTSSVH